MSTQELILMSFYIYPRTSDDRSTEEVRPEMLFIIHNGHSTEMKQHCKAGRNGWTMGVITNTLQDQELGLGCVPIIPALGG